MKPAKSSPQSPQFRLYLGSPFMNCNLEILSRQPSGTIVGLGSYFTHLLGITVRSGQMSNFLETAFSYILSICWLFQVREQFQSLLLHPFFHILNMFSNNLSETFLCSHTGLLDASHLSSSFTVKYFCKCSL